MPKAKTNRRHSKETRPVIQEKLEALPDGRSMWLDLSDYPTYTKITSLQNAVHRIVRDFMPGIDIKTHSIDERLFVRKH